MKISLNWLKEFVHVSEDVESLGRKVTSVGLALESIESAGDDTVLELDITTNRPDCLNHMGVAREVSAIYGRPLRKPDISFEETGTAIQDVFSITIDDQDLCERYCGRYIAGVKIGPSPQWLKSRLEAVGIRSINNVADVTNYVLMEVGQPLHAFDADTLQGRQIVVRRAGIDEAMTTLDGIERKLDPSVLVIADAAHAIAVAGIMGGVETEISPSTTSVLLESAYFNPRSIRKTSRSVGLSTEASYRFERGADIGMARYACDRAAALIAELSGGTIYRGAIDIYPQPKEPLTATLRRHRINEFLGAPVDDSIVENILERLEFRVTRMPDGWSLQIPSFRVDVGGEEDLLEEIARHYGYDKFPATLPVSSGYGSVLPMETEERLLRNLLSGMGYSEIIGLAFSDASTERKFSPAIDPVKLLNPMVEDQSVLRTSLVSTVFRAIQWNINRGIRNLQFYELGKVYRAGSERRSLILAGTGALRTKNVHESERDFTFYDLKGDVEQILEAFDVDAELQVPLVSTDPATAGGLGSPLETAPSYYHPARSAAISGVAAFGEVHPDVGAEFKLRQRVYVAELEIETILKSRKKHMARIIPRLPSIRRDFSLVLGKTTRFAEVQAVIASANIGELIRVEPFDRLENGPFPESKYSLSISLIYQSPDRTLTDSEVETFDRQILTLLEERLGAALRN